MLDNTKYIRFELGVSSEHDRFVTGVETRPVIKSLVKKLVHSFQVNGWLMGMPAVVIKLPSDPTKFQVLDGQHRVLAAKEIGLPICFWETPDKLSSAQWNNLPFQRIVHPEN